MLELENISVRYGEANALVSVNLAVVDGEHLAVLGPSGSGKSTLLRVIAGLEPPSTGTIGWDGRDLAGEVDCKRIGGKLIQAAIFRNDQAARLRQQRSRQPDCNIAGGKSPRPFHCPYVDFRPRIALWHNPPKYKA